MPIELKNSTKKLKSTPFSDFIRSASSREKKRVYTLVLEKASKRQNEVIDKVEKQLLVSSDEPHPTN